MKYRNIDYYLFKSHKCFWFETEEMINSKLAKDEVKVEQMDTLIEELKTKIDNSATKGLLSCFSLLVATISLIISIIVSKANIQLKIQDRLDKYTPNEGLIGRESLSVADANDYKATIENAKIAVWIIVILIVILLIYGGIKYLRRWQLQQRLKWFYAYKRHLIAMGHSNNLN